MGHGIAHEYYLHIVAGVGDSGLAGAEEVEYGVEEDETQGTNSDTHQQVERNGIAQQVLGDTIVALSQFHGDRGRGSHTDGGTERSREVHEGQRDGQSRYGERTYYLSQEHAVGDIVERRGGHGNDSWQGKLPQQPPYWLRSQF